MRRFAQLLTVIVTLFFARAVLAEKPVGYFFKKPQFAGLSLSPSGRYMLVLRPFKGHMNVFVLDLKTDRMTQTTSILTQDVAAASFVTNERIIFSVDKDGHGDFRLYAIDRSGKRPRTLVDPAPGRSAVVIDRLKGMPHQVLISYNKTRSQYPDLYRINTLTGRMLKVLDNPGHAVSYVMDHNQVIRVALERDGLEQQILYRSSARDAWRVIDKRRRIDPSFTPVAFDYDNKHLFVLSNIQSDKRALYRYDPETKTFAERILVDDTYDVNGLILSDSRRKLVAASIYREKAAMVYFDRDFATMMEGLKSSFKGAAVALISHNEAEDTYIVGVYSDRNPGTYYLYNRRQGSLKKLLESRRWISPQEMAKTIPITFKSRDGLEIHGYLTLPKNYHKDAAVPLILNPHGGPYGIRDTWGFNPEQQLFADRGWATLQVNYRGSGGYGRKFMTLGYQQWGLTMQNDLTDAVKWAIKQGYADAKHVCIYGASYGGYAAIAGLTLTPELYSCGIDSVGVTDVALSFTTLPRRWEALRGVMNVQIGDPADNAFMARLPPIKHVDKIRAPVFIVQGLRDPRGNFKHATELRRELDRLHKPYEWMVKGKEGHGFHTQEPRLDFYIALDRFLKKYL